MKTRTLPPFNPRLTKNSATELELFVFNHEPEGVRESNAFRRELLAVLNGCCAPDEKWVDGEAR